MPTSPYLMTAIALLAIGGFTQRVGRAERGAMHVARRAIHRGDQLDAARVDLEGQPGRRVQPDESARERRQVTKHLRRCEPTL